MKPSNIDQSLENLDVRKKFNCAVLRGGKESKELVCISALNSDSDGDLVEDRKEADKEREEGTDILLESIDSMARQVPGGQPAKIDHEGITFVTEQMFVGVTRREGATSGDDGSC